MKRYWRVYALLLRLNLESLLAYRANFINSLVSSILWGLFSLYSIVLLTSRTTSIQGWQRDEILLLNGVYGIFIALFHIFFSINFENFSSIIHLGQLDSVLIKPLDSQFQLTFWRFTYTTILRLVIATAYVLYLIAVMRINISVVDIMVFLLLIAVSLLLLYSLWYCVITLTIWFTRLSNLVILMFQVTGMARFPREMFLQGGQFVFWFLLPLTILINVPTKVFLARIDFVEMAILIGLSFFVFVLSRKFWKFALRHYTSASS